MAQEIEAKILGIDVEQLEEKLKEIGAERVGEKLLRSIAFDYPGFPLDNRSAWVRIRTDGKETTVAYKERLGVTDNNAGLNDSGMKEIETVVENFDAMRDILLSIGMIIKHSNEKRRVTWKKGGVVFDIDFWPRLDPYLEVEGDSWESVDHAIEKLGYNLSEKVICSSNQIYEKNGIHVLDYTELTFDRFVKREE